MDLLTAIAAKLWHNLFSLGHLPWTIIFAVYIVIAFTRGRRIERLVAGVVLPLYLLQKVLPRIYIMGTNVATFAVDLSVLALLLWATFKTRTLWPIFAAGTHLVAIFVHLGRAIRPEATAYGGWAYYTAQLILGQLTIIALAVGAWRSRRS